MDNTHLNALRLRLSNERVRLSEAKTEKEKALRKAWIAQIEKEISGEEIFLGETEMTDEELLKSLAE